MSRSVELEVLLAALGVCIAADRPRGCALVCASSRGSRRAPLSTARWLALVDEHQLGPLLGARSIADGSFAARLPSGALPWLRAAHLSAGADAMLRGIELLELLERLEREIPVVVLKGAALVFTFYAESAEREMSDVDLLFASPEHAARARALLRDRGYVEAPNDTRADHHHLPPLRHGVREMSLELHTDLATPPLPPAALAALFASRRRVGLERGRSVPVLDPMGACLHHAIHALADPIDSPLLRNLFEVGALATGLSIEERARLAAFAEEHGLVGRVAPALRLASVLFGSPPVFARAPRCPVERWALRRLEWTGTRHPGPLERSRRLASPPAFGWAEVPGFLDDVARRHLAHRDEPGRRVSLLRALAGALFHWGHSMVRPAPPPVPRRVRPALLRTATVGRSLLAHDPETGSVHLMNGRAAALWLAAREEPDTQVHIARFLERGLTEAETRAALEDLWSRGLLRAE